MGLENYLTEDTSQKIRRRRAALWEAVFSEQPHQLDVGVRDCEAILVISEGLSQKPRVRARIIGLLHTAKAL